MDEKIRVFENMLEIVKADLSALLEIAKTHHIPEDIAQKQIDNYLEDIHKIMQEIEKLKNK